MSVRKPDFAGSWYPSSSEDCLRTFDHFEQSCVERQGKDSWRGGIVPHAGWVFSGSLAAMVFSAFKKQCGKVDTFVIFGAAHSHFGDLPAVYDSGAWMTPLGQVEIDEELAGEVVNSGAAEADCTAHKYEHSIEVHVPFVSHLFPEAKILPVIVPPARKSVKLGDVVGDIIKRRSAGKIVCIGSTDLTHYGPGYGFEPVGVGPDALHWAMSVNDKKFIDLAIKLEAEEMLASAAENGNACGAGAAAAAAAAARKSGKAKGLLLAHTNSSETMLRQMQTYSDNSVGYAAIVF